MVKNRYLHKIIEELCFSSHKMAFISGPRQSGKTTLAKVYLQERGAGQYFNWDENRFCLEWAKHPLAIVENVLVTTTKTPVIIFDEIHKTKLWKRNIKGIYDSVTKPADIFGYIHFHWESFSVINIL